MTGQTEPVSSLGRRYDDGDKLGVREQSLSPDGNQLSVEVGSRLLKQVRRTVDAGREVFHVPVDAVDVVLSGKELNLLESFRIRKITLDAWVHL